jgi:hypothetical protein
VQESAAKGFSRYRSQQLKDSAYRICRYRISRCGFSRYKASSLTIQQVQESNGTIEKGIRLQVHVQEYRVSSYRIRMYSIVSTGLAITGAGSLSTRLKGHELQVQDQHVQLQKVQYSITGYRIIRIWSAGAGGTGSSGTHLREFLH